MRLLRHIRGRMITMTLVLTLTALRRSIRVVPRDDAASSPEQWARLRAAWSRCDARLVETEQADTDAAAGPITVSVGVAGVGEDAFAALAEQISSRVTLAAIEANRGDLLMFHACAVADPDTGAVVAFVGPSGRGKTTASRVLAERFGYVSDETVAVTESLEVVPYPKPLSVITRPGSPKQQLSPDELGLGPTPARALTLRRVVLLERDPDHEGPPELVAVTLAERLSELVAQTSYLSAHPHPLERLARTIEGCGGLHLVRYREAASLVDLVVDLFAESRPAPADLASSPAIQPLPRSRNGALSGVSSDAQRALPELGHQLWRRAPDTDAVTEGEHVIVHHGGSIRVLAGIAPCLWQSLFEWTDLDAATRFVLAEVGPPDGVDPVEAVQAALVELTDAGLLERRGGPLSSTNEGAERGTR